MLVIIANAVALALLDGQHGEGAVAKKVFNGATKTGCECVLVSVRDVCAYWKFASRSEYCPPCKSTAATILGILLDISEEPSQSCSENRK